MTSRSKPDKTAVVSFRCTEPLLKRLDAYLRQLQLSAPGGNWTRSSAAMNLVVKGLDDSQKSEGGS